MLTSARIDGKPAIEVLFRAYDMALTKAGFLAMGGQIIDASIVAAPKQRNTDGEKAGDQGGTYPRCMGGRRKKPPDRPMPATVARANGAKSKVRAGVEHAFAHQ